MKIDSKSTNKLEIVIDGLLIMFGQEKLKTATYFDLRWFGDNSNLVAPCVTLTFEQSEVEALQRHLASAEEAARAHQERAGAAEAKLAKLQQEQPITKSEKNDVFSAMNDLVLANEVVS